MTTNTQSKMMAVFTVIESETLEKPRFRRIGNGFVNRDSSLNLWLDALPLNGKLHVREARPADPNDNEG